eukprot:5991030-Pleurochrysis_carterae.AAC.1
MRSCKTKQRFRDFDASNLEDNHGISRFAAKFPARFLNLCVPSTAGTLPYRLIRRVLMSNSAIHARYSVIEASQVVTHYGYSPRPGDRCRVAH